MNAIAIELPTWEECEAAVRLGRFTALQYFIWANEIDGPTEASEWRKSLAAALTEVATNTPSSHSG